MDEPAIETTNRLDMLWKVFSDAALEVTSVSNEELSVLDENGCNLLLALTNFIFTQETKEEFRKSIIAQSISKIDTLETTPDEIAWRPVTGKPDVSVQGFFLEAQKYELLNKLQKLTNKSDELMKIIADKRKAFTRNRKELQSVQNASSWRKIN